MADPVHGQPVSTTVDRAGRLLQLLVEHPEGLGVTELTRLLNTQRAPLYRILESLIRHQLVRRDNGKRYLLGIGTVRLAQAYSSQYPAGTDQILADLANRTGITAMLVSAEGDVLTTIVAMTPATNEEHVYTPPGFIHPETGQLASRIALEASRPPAPSDSEAVRRARERGFAIAKRSDTHVRDVAATVVPGSERTGVALVVALVSMRDFDEDAVAGDLLDTAQLLAMPFQHNGRH